MKNKKLKTALIIGRWQPWHKGHRELFKAALDRAERVAIGVRSTYATDGKNPFTFEPKKTEILKIKPTISLKNGIMELIKESKK